MALQGNTKAKLAVGTFLALAVFLVASSSFGGAMLTYLQNNKGTEELTADDISKGFADLFSEASDHCTPQNVAAAPNAGNTLSPDATLEASVKAVVGNKPRIAVSMLVASYVETKGDTNYEGDGAFGAYKLENPGSGDYAGITVAQAKNAAYATNFMAPFYANALNRVDPELWKTNPQAAAESVGFYANKQQVAYDVSSGVGTVLDAYDRAIEEMKKQGISTDFSTNHIVDPAAAIPNSTGASGQTVIAIDPGHGGALDQYTDDQGPTATGLADRETDNNPERADVLDVANKVKTQLEAAGYKVVLLRTGVDQVISKRDRVNEALRQKASLAISIHTAENTSGPYDYVWPQRLGNYREYSGKRVEITNAAVAALSQTYATNIANARTTSEGHAISLDTDSSAEMSAFTRDDVPSKGNESIIQLWGQDIPWVYNEITRDQGNAISDDMKDKYAAGLVKGIEQSVPPASVTQAVTPEDIFQQRLFAGVEDPELAKSIVDKYPNIGGIFQISSGSPGRVSDGLKGVAAVLQSAVKTPLFIATDQEFTDSVNSYGLSPTPKASDFASYTAANATVKAQAMAASLLAAGVNMDFAPVADLQIDSNPAIGQYNRGVSSDPGEVSKIVGGMVQGFIQGKVAPVIKHYPGHGETQVDSHSALAVTPNMTDMDNSLQPFKDLAGTANMSIMVGHLVVPGLTGDTPASMSPDAYKYLRDTLGFKGVTITDELGMNGASFGGTVGNRIALSLNAGADMALFNVSSMEEFDNAYNEAKGLVTTTDNNRILDLKQAFGLLNVGPAPPVAPAVGTAGATTIGALDGNMVPEPMRSIIIKAANASDIPPAAIAALYLTENNGFPFALAEFDGKGKAAYTSLTPTSPEWHLGAYGDSGNWAANAGNFQGPFQFGTPAWSDFGTDGNGDGDTNVYNFTDAAFSAGKMLKARGVKNGDQASIVNGAREYNGQVLWNGIQYPNTDKSRFPLVQDFYAYQVGELVTALSGGDTTGNTVALNCVAASNNVVQGISTEYGVTGQRQTAIQVASSEFGVRYSWGGGNKEGPTVGTSEGCSSSCFANNDPNTPGFDCSGLMLYTFAHVGIALPRNSNDQWMALSASHEVSQDKAQPGDLVFFGNEVHHVGLYIGNDQMINAPQSGDVVKVGKVSAHSDLRGFADPYAWAAAGGH